MKQHWTFLQADPFKAESCACREVLFFPNSRMLWDLCTILISVCSGGAGEVPGNTGFREPVPGLDGLRQVSGVPKVPGSRGLATVNRGSESSPRFRSFGGFNDFEGFRGSEGWVPGFCGLQPGLPVEKGIHHAVPRSFALATGLATPEGKTRPRTTGTRKYKEYADRGRNAI